ncbi:UNVERIFIED_CONTAM: hypothetical protein Sradi_6201000 [Sesamum radiatum]|uniref:Uncharacterized protein n=1 Tax=Sesamum radiatum TaxID=300843 RepID=A0AAW2K904_SESRA
MLDIRDMSEKDKLFTFMESLKPWARLELQRQRVTDLGSAMAAAEHLTDFASETRKDRQTTSNPVQNKTGGAKSFRSNPTEVGKTESPTLRLDCLKKQLLNALAIFSDKTSPTKPVEPQASTSGGNDSKEDEDNLGAISQWCNTLSHQVAAKKTMPLQAGKTASSLTGSHPEDEAQP